MGHLHILRELPFVQYDSRILQDPSSFNHRGGPHGGERPGLGESGAGPGRSWQFEAAKSGKKNSQKNRVVMKTIGKFTPEPWGLENNQRM